MNAEKVDVKSELDRVVADFFRAVSFEQGAQPPYQELYKLFIREGLIIKNTAPEPEIFSVEQFIEPRQKMVASGELASFREAELSEVTEIFGNVAQRFSSYEKAGVLNGAAFQGRGMIVTQFIRTPAGWKISALAWDDERPGLSIP